MMRQNLFPRLYSVYFGIRLPILSFRLILSQPKLIIWSLIPIMITLGLYFVLFSQIQTWIFVWMTQLLTKWGIATSGWVFSLFTILMKILLIVFGALTFSFVSTIAACPFNDFLAENTERFSTPQLPQVLDRSWGFRIKLIWIDIFKSTLSIVLNIALLFMSWIPGVNFGALACAFLLLCFQYISYPQTRRGKGVGEGFRFIWNHFYACLGFGAIHTFLFSIPLVSSFALPLAVVGGTLLVARAQGNESMPPLR